jgi:hypothetical protein
MLIGLTGVKGKTTVATYLQEFYGFRVVRRLPKVHEKRRLVLDGCKSPTLLAKAGGLHLNILGPGDPLWPVPAAENFADGVLLVLPVEPPNSTQRCGQEGFGLVDRAIAKLALLEVERLAR